MKKIIFAALSVLMMLSLVGCGEHLVDFKVIDLSGGAVPGDWAIPANWDNTTPFTSIDKDNSTYTFEFTVKDDLAAGSDVGFKILTVNGNWNVAGYTEFEVTVDGEEVTANYKDNCGPAGNAFVKGCEAGKTYKMTVVCNSDSSATVSVVSMADPVYPVPYYLDGLFLVGAVFDGGWDIDASDLIWGASVDTATGIVTYTKDIKATAASGELGINDSAWGNKQLGVGVTITAGEDYKVLDGEAGNFNVSGLKVGGAYRVYIQTTPEKAVSVKVEEICTLTFKFKITGLTEGMEAWLNGSVWGSGWPCGWPLAAWGTPGNGLELTDAAVADESGVAVFSDKWNMTTVAKPGDSLSYQVKFVASDDSWATTKYDNANIDINIEVEGDATYLITVNAADNTAIVTKE